MALPITSQPKLERELEERISSIKAQEVEEKARDRAKKLSLPYLNLKTFPIDSAAVFLVSEAEAHAGQLAIVAKTGQIIRVALLDPAGVETQKILENLKKDGYTLELAIVSPAGLAIAWRRYQLKRETQTELGVVEIKEQELAKLQEQIKDVADLKERLTQMPITQVLNILIAGALKTKASDIHLESEEKDIRLRYRLDGVLYDIISFSPAGYGQLLSRIKLMSGLKINIHDAPQDGRFTIRQERADIEVRVSVLPGGYGENIVMRILDPATIRQELGDLGMRAETLAAIQKLLQKTTGAILTTGPTGSGKTTTLYAFLKHINSPDLKIITIEDPIEYRIVGISQTQVDEEAGYTFGGGLRSIVRQDPDIILVGEIRDVETAEIAMQAALTGHLVFSTLHTNNAAGAIPRLINFGVKPVTIAPAINAVMAQRLVRRLCPACRKKERIKKADYDLMARAFVKLTGTVKAPEISQNTEIYYPGQCQECNSAGYRGRVGVYELFEINPEMEKLILQSPAISEVQEFAVSQGMVTLLQDGLLKALAGLTSVEEVTRVIGE